MKRSSIYTTENNNH